MTCPIKKVLVAITLTFCVWICFGGSRSFQVKGQLQGKDPFSNWRPHNDAQGVSYVGSVACAHCHATEAASHSATPMAQALQTATDCRVLIKTPRLSFRNGPYFYEISRRGKRVVYKVTDGINTISEPILFCFGQGAVGQTYTFRHDDVFYETRVSYFRKIQGLDFTIGHRQSVPTSLEESLGRKIGVDETQSCFGCHSTGGVNKDGLDLGRLIPGVGCEACHGPGEKHIVAAKADKLAYRQIFNPGNLNANDLTQSFCASCHTSFEQAMLMPGQSGINNIRFQPYRIFNSPGHNKNDPRLSCIACHNPHQKLETRAVFYDSKCLACHLTRPEELKTARRTAPACPISTGRCVTCHMPKVELPGMHAAFTDHWIRIARPNEGVPN